MDCAALQSQLSELRSLHQTFQSDFNHMNETGTGNIALQSSQRVASAKTDELLGQYLDDFIEKNPDVFLEWQAERFHQNAQILASTPLQGDRLLISFHTTDPFDSPLKIFRYGSTKHDLAEDHESPLAQRIATNNIPHGDIPFFSVSPNEQTLFFVSGDKMFVSDQYGTREIPALNQEKHGRNAFDGFINETAVAFLDEHSALISSNSGLFYCNTSNLLNDTVTKLDPPFEAKRDETDDLSAPIEPRIVSLTTIADGRVLIGSSYGTAVIYDHQSGEYHKVEGELRDGQTGYTVPVQTATVLPNGKVLIGGVDSSDPEPYATFCELKSLPNGDFTFSPPSKIDYSYDTPSSAGAYLGFNHISTILPLPDSDHIIIGSPVIDAPVPLVELCLLDNEDWEAIRAIPVGKNATAQNEHGLEFPVPPTVLSSGKVVTFEDSTIYDTSDGLGAGPIPANDICVSTKPTPDFATLKHNLSRLASSTVPSNPVYYDEEDIF